MTATKNLVAITPGGDVTPDMIAGYYLIYSVPELDVPLSRVRKAFADHGLDTTRLPEERRPEHVMQDACTSAQRITQNGKREEIRAQQVGRDEKFLIYQMTRHVHDIKKRVINHPKVLRVLFSFEDGSLEFETLGGSRGDDDQSLEDEIRAYYKRHQKRLPGRGLRTIVRHYIEAAGGEWLRDGAYFLASRNAIAASNRLHEHHGDSIDGREFIAAMQAALHDIYDHEPEFHPIPCINDEGQRAFLKRKFLENCAEDLKEYRDECLALVTKERKRGFRYDKRTGMVDRRREIEARRQKFAAILGETLDELDRDMQLADKALARFLTEADA